MTIVRKSRVQLAEVVGAAIVSEGCQHPPGIWNPPDQQLLHKRVAERKLFLQLLLEDSAARFVSSQGDGGHSSQVWLDIRVHRGLGRDLWHAWDRSVSRDSATQRYMHGSHHVCQTVDPEWRLRGSCVEDGGEEQRHRSFRRTFVLYHRALVWHNERMQHKILERRRSSPGLLGMPGTRPKLTWAIQPCLP